MSKKSAHCCRAQFSAMLWQMQILMRFFSIVFLLYMCFVHVFFLFFYIVFVFSYNAVRNDSLKLWCFKRNSCFLNNNGQRERNCLFFLFQWWGEVIKMLGNLWISIGKNVFYNNNKVNNLKSGNFQIYTNNFLKMFFCARVVWKLVFSCKGFKKTI